jgi:recombination protein RecT
MPNVRQAVANREEASAAGATLRDAIKRSEEQFANALPQHVDPKRFLRAALTALGTVPRLAECTQISVLAGLMQAAQLGLEISDVRGQAYLIPRNVRNVMTATFQLGYRGMIDLAARGGITVDVDEICENDAYDFQRGTSPRLYHKPTLGPRGAAIAYYAVAHFSDGRPATFAIIGRGEAEEHRDKFASSRDYNSKEVSGPWVDHFDAMARKTVIRQLLNYLPTTVELRQAAAIEATAHDDPMPAVAYLNPNAVAAQLAPAPELEPLHDVTDAEATDTPAAS